MRGRRRAEDDIRVRVPLAKRKEDRTEESRKSLERRTRLFSVGLVGDFGTRRSDEKKHPDVYGWCVKCWHTAAEFCGATMLVQ